MHWEIDPTGARIAQLATDLTARIDALDPESDTPVYSDFSFSIAVADWTLANGVYTARVNNTVLLTENAGIQVFYDASLRTGLTGDIFADKHTGYIDFTTTLQPVGPISGIVRVLDSVSGMLSVAKGGTGAATPKRARENLDTPIRDIPVDFGTVSSLPQTIYDADITANMVAFDASFGNPAAVPGGIDVTFAAGSVTISGTMTSGQETTIKFWCHEQRTAVEGTESGSAEPRVNEFVHVGAQTLTTDQQAQIRTNLGAASASDLANGVYVSDCNNATSGHVFYYADGNTLNKPSGVSSWLLIKVVGKSGGFFTQIASEENVINGRIWYRTKSANSFGDWIEIGTFNNISNYHRVSITNNSLNRVYSYKCGKTVIVYGLVAFSDTSATITDLEVNNSGDYVPFTLFDSSTAKVDFFNLNPSATSVQVTGVTSSHYYVAMCAYSTS